MKGYNYPQPSGVSLGFGEHQELLALDEFELK